MQVSALAPAVGSGSLHRQLQLGTSRSSAPSRQPGYRCETAIRSEALFYGASAVVVASIVAKHRQSRNPLRAPLSPAPRGSCFVKAGKQLSQCRIRCGAQEAETKESEKEEEPSIEERFEGFTRVLPWFDFAAKALDAHVERRQRALEDATELPPALQQAVGDKKKLSQALLDAIEVGAGSLPDAVEAALRTAEKSPGESVSVSHPAEMLEQLRGRWQVVWSGGMTPLLGLPRQCLWVEVTGENVPVLTVHSGLPLVLFGAYVWTSTAGEIVHAPPLKDGGREPTLIRLNRYWIDVGTEPRGDIGRVDGEFVNNRLKAFAAALLTPILLEFGALKWLFERFGMQKVFEVEVPSPEGEGKTVKLEASLELYLTLLAMVSFPETLSTCPIPFLDTDAGVCVFEIPMLGPASDLPRWLHPGGNAAALVARRLKDDETPSLMMPAA